MTKDCFISWSGGKDSCLAMYKAIELGYKPKKLFTMFSIENQISSAHRLSEEILKAQADAIGISSYIGKATFEEYENVFIHSITSFKAQGMNYGVFGDVDIDQHREWEENVCKKASLQAVLPLWQMNRKDIVKEFIDLGFKAKIIVVNTTMLSTSFLGQDLSYPLMNKIEDYGADVCGENGEYHTIVYDGPIFKKPLPIKYGDEIIPIEDRWAQIKTIL